ncbi:MAG TPA: NAD-dependent epimerase/dehydratase family protein [Steroidobacteraceae bacterium]|nr:NAD-dependent epimerase/dehydratase family protein [Steroidobacteraceae bacterium]
MKIAVIGGSGFIGTRLCRRLALRTDLSFDIVDKARSSAFPQRCRIADVRSAQALRAVIEPGATLVNLAAEHRDDVQPRQLYDEVNVQGARKICDVARERAVPRIIFTSSVAVYGFAAPGTDESGRIAPFNDYGRTKFEAELVFREWQAEASAERSLVIVRPTVVFGERNRGNVYNLLRQIASGFFVMIGPGDNRKSMAYVENVAAFLEHCLGFQPGVHLYNLIDKPDFTMNSLVATVQGLLGRNPRRMLRIPLPLGYLIGRGFDAAAAITGRSFPISTIRVRKFTSSTVFSSRAEASGFEPPFALSEALARTVRSEFIDSPQAGELFFSE